MISGAFYGKKKRMGRLFADNKILIVPVDDSLIFGPEKGLYNLSKTLESIVNGSPNAILGFKGSYSILMDEVKGIKTPFIYNLTASTTSGQHVQKVKIGTVKEALIMGADCVAAHINYTSDFENEMISSLSEIISEADGWGMPTLAISYPRKKNPDGTEENYNKEKKENEDLYTRIICRCVRTSAELGADIIKTQYTGSAQSFEKVVKCSLGKPVVIAGGPVISVPESYKMAKEAMDAGAAGISYGRNIFNSENIEAYLEGIKAIIFGGASVSEAVELFEEKKNGI